MVPIDDATNIGWPVLLPDKSAATVTHDFPTFLAAVNVYGKSAYLRSDNELELTNKAFHKLMADNNTRRDYTSIDGPKLNGWMGRKLALVAEGGMEAFAEPQLMVDGVEVTAKTLAYGRT